MTIRLENPTKSVTGGTGGVSDHALLSNLDYASAAHTGFEPVLTSGINTQYYRGDKIWAVLITGGASGSTDHAALANLTSATAGHTGYQATIVSGSISGSSPVAVTSGTAALLGALSITMAAATTAADGYLTSTDFTTFTNKQSTLTTGNLTATTPLTLDNTRQVIGGAAVASMLTSGSGNVVLVTSATINTPTITAASDVTPLRIKRGTDTTPAANLIEVYKNDNATLLSTLAFDGRWRLAIASASPSITTGTGAGVGATASLTGTDSSGEITVTTAGLPSTAATIVTITFNRTFTNAPAVVFSPSNAVTALLSGTSMVFATSTTASYSLTSGSVGLTTGQVYNWFYHCLGQ